MCLPAPLLSLPQEMQDALTSCEEEKNALKRQLAKLSKKYQAVTAAAAHTAGIVAGAQAVQLQQRQEAEEPSAAASDETESAGDLALLHDDDSELEVGQGAGGRGVETCASWSAVPCSGAVVPRRCCCPPSGAHSPGKPHTHVLPLPVSAAAGLCLPDAATEDA